MKDLDQQGKTIYLKDYQPPDFWIEQVDLTFELEEERTRVVSQLKLKKHENSSASSLVLMGECLELGEVKVDGSKIESSGYIVTETTLTVLDVPDVFTLEIETFTKPQENLSL